MKRARLWMGMAFLLAVAGGAPGAMNFHSPLSGTVRSNWFIINFMDHGDGTTPLDYAGGRQTYATHTGIDIMLYDFLTMDEGIAVLAAAPGTVLWYVDGLDDRLLNSQPNNIFLRHADGSVSYYAHLKRSSILVSTGQVVAAGQKMAEVGGDGTNEVSHLHFGVLDRWATNGVWCEIMTNQFGLAQSFDWFDTYSNQVIRQVYGLGITHTNDPVFLLPAWRQQQTPSSYSLMHSGPFSIWIKYTGRTTNDFLAVRLLSQAGPGATIDFTSCGWYTKNYVIFSCPLWESSWLGASLSNGTTYTLQYRWNEGEWRDGPGESTFSVADDRQEVYLSRISLPAYSNAPATPASLAASAGAYTNGIRLTWAPSSNTVYYAVYRNEGGGPGPTSLLVRTSNTGFDDTNVASETACYYRIAAVNAAGTSSLSGAVLGWRAEPAGSGPEVRINNHCRPCPAVLGEPVTVTVQLQPEAYAGIEADWWVLAQAPWGWYCFRSGNWAPATEGLWPAYQGPLFELPPTVVLNSADLPAGDYAFYFGVDLRDNVLDIQSVWFDAAALAIR